ncbi:MAG: 16S rRNA (uracil(1498)-N(3))-methyltransferase [Clostridiales Family XIII bacterium]|jgi:16S rRNA (uracil1498-N3)-methyltransferase|nr:16S rRNA (uracil(1498)-N(3))-methyltransferase [Clostridiales Family XIII bacterium]
MRRIFAHPVLDEIDEARGVCVLAAPDEVRHVKSVLRMRPGEECVFSNGVDREFRVALAGYEGDTAVFRILAAGGLATESAVQVTLFQCLPKGQKMEEIIQKSTELGVARIVPVHAARCQVKADAVREGKLARYRKVAAEAAKQSGRGRVPEVSAPVTAYEAAAALDGFALGILAYEEETGRTVKDVLREAAAEGLLKAGGARVAVFVGPEGGFEAAEAAAFTAAGARACSLGQTILRTETAGPAVLAMLRYEVDL